MDADMEARVLKNGILAGDEGTYITAAQALDKAGVDLSTVREQGLALTPHGVVFSQFVTLGRGSRLARERGGRIIIRRRGKLLTRNGGLI